MKRILITNGLLRMSLAAVRSLGSRGVEVIATEKTRTAPALLSKYCTFPVLSPDGRTESQQYLEWLYSIIDKYHPDIIFPMDDDIMDLMIANRSDLEKHCHLPLPLSESYWRARDKGLAVKVAQKVGVNCPDTREILALEDLPKLALSLKYPLIIKPRLSSGSRGMKIVCDRRELVSLYRQVHKDYPFPLIQEYLPQGERFDVGLLYNKAGGLRAAFVQKEIRHFPLERGPSTVQESIYFPELVEQAAALLNELKWHGVAEVEFMRDPTDGKLKFMEINPRFWGSLQLAILAGIDFPWLLYKMTAEGDVKETFQYETGLRCRTLLPGDMLHFLFCQERFNLDPPFLAGKKEKVYDDIMSKDDPKPAVGAVLSCLRYSLDKRMWNFMFQR